MDPVLCLERLLKALEEEDVFEVDCALRDLCDWAAKGGFLPVVQGPILGIYTPARMGHAGSQPHLIREVKTELYSTDGRYGIAIQTGTRSRELRWKLERRAVKDKGRLGHVIGLWTFPHEFEKVGGPEDT